VDEDRRFGRFLLTGSANLMVLPKVTESLAGRMETVILLPLSQSEIHRETTNWLDNVFAGRIPEAAVPVVGDDMAEIVVKGGYPEALARQTPRRRTAWCRQYVDALIQRDVRDIADIEKQDQLPRFLRALSQMAGQLCNYTKLGGQVGLDSKTAAKYMGVLEHMFLTKRIEPWTDNRLSRVVKTPKLQFIDSGLLTTLAGFSAISSPGDRIRFGHFLESFVFGELLKHATTADSDYHIFYYRDHDKVEVDYVVENTAGFLAGVEVKAAATVKENDLKGIRRLAKAAGRKWLCGIILYDGDITLPLGKNIWAAPLSSLWGNAP
jgi:predicted AAA+ superfamily ATPase